MMRSQFDRELETLHKELVEMGAVCEEAIALASKALTEGDKALAQRVPALEAETDRMEHAIESLCLKLLLRQQPVARDLRQISAALKIITDMERIGDQAADIADITAQLDKRSDLGCAHIQAMAQATIRMVTESVDAFVRGDVALARAAVAHDDVVDACFLQVKSDLTGLIATQKDQGEYALDLLMIAKYFERIGDHAANIAEWVVFSVTGTREGGTDP